MQEKIPERPIASEQSVAEQIVPEQQGERTAESEPTRRGKRVETGAEQAASRQVAPGSATQTSATHDPEIQGIETILATGLDGFFKGLSPAEQLRFKTEGESTALKIKQLLHAQKTKIKDIVKLIINWLKGLPGINKFFLEQEAKIKADAIVRRYRP